MVLANGTLSKENDMSYLYNQVSDRDGIIAAYVTQYGPCLSVTAGTMTSDATYFYYTFLDTGTIKFPRTISATVLIVGGGGAGGGRMGGGGGGGGVLEQTFTLAANTTYIATVGAGGVGAYLAGSNGTSSSFASVTAYGGGRGAIFWRGTTYLSAYDAGTGSGVVGSGGGGSYGTDSPPAWQSPGVGTAGQGNSGGAAYTASSASYASGGGGGAGAAGGAAGNQIAGTGGAGKTSVINSVVYGAGGNGGPQNGAGATGAAGAANTGNGGFGIRNADDNNVAYGGSGGKGIIIIRIAK